MRRYVCSWFWSDLGDWWEEEHFTNSAATDGSTDLDGDGHDERAEFIAGTDPLSPTSRLEVTEVDGVSTNGFEIRWLSVTDTYYSVHLATNPAGDFTVLASNIAATPSENVFADTSAVNRARSFYRITTSLPSGPR